MRDYGKVLPTFWQRGSGRALRGNKAAQLLAIYVFTAPAGNATGIFYLPIATIAHETGLTIEEVRMAFDDLSRLDIAHFDEEEALVFVPNMAAVAIGPEEIKPGDKRRPWAQRTIDALPRHRFTEMLRRSEGPLKGLRWPDTKLSEATQPPTPSVAKGNQEGASSCAEAPSKGHAGLAGLRSDLEEEQEEEQEEIPPKPPQGGATTGGGTLTLDLGPPATKPRRQKRGTTANDEPVPPSTATDAELEAWLLERDIPSIDEPVWGATIESMIERARSDRTKSSDWGAKYRTCCLKAIEWGHVQVDRSYPRMRSKLPAPRTFDQDTYGIDYSDVAAPPQDPDFIAFKAKLKAEGWEPPPMPNTAPEVLDVLAGIAGVTARPRAERSEEQS